MLIMMRALVVAVAVMGLAVTGAQADLLLRADLSGSDLPPDNAAETTFLENKLASDVFLKLNSDTTSGGITVTGVNATSGTVDWDLTGTGIELEWVVVVDGGVAGPGNTKLYNVYEVINGQGITDGPGVENVICCSGVEKGISHFVFLGGEVTNGVPEPATLLLLGAGLVGTVSAGRRLARRRDV